MDNGIELTPEKPKDDQQDNKKMATDKPDIDELAQTFSTDEDPKKIDMGEIEIPSLEDINTDIEEEIKPADDEKKEEISVDQSENAGINIEKDLKIDILDDEKENNDIIESSSGEPASLDKEKDIKSDAEADLDKIDLADITFDINEEVTDTEEKIEMQETKNAVPSTIDDNIPDISDDSKKDDNIETAEKLNIGNDNIDFNDLEIGESSEHSQENKNEDASSSEQKVAEAPKIDIPVENINSEIKIPVKNISIHDENGSKETTEMKDKPKKKRKPLLLFFLILIITGGGYFYFGILGPGQKKPVDRKTTVKTRMPQKQPLMQAKKPIYVNPYVFSEAENLKKDENEGIITYVFNSSADIHAVRNFYKNKLISMNYRLKTDEYEPGKNFAHLIFSKINKICSVVIKGDSDGTDVIVSYVK